MKHFLSITILCVLSFSIYAQTKVEQTIFQVGPKIKTPVTVRTSKGTFSLYDTYPKTMSGVINVYSAKDANGNSIIVSSSYRWKTGVEHNKHYSCYIRTYEFKTLLSGTSSSSSSSVGTRSGYSSSYGKYAYQTKHTRWNDSDDDDGDDYSDDDDDDDESEAIAPKVNYIYRKSNDRNSYGYNATPRDGKRAEVELDIAGSYTVPVYGAVKTITIDYWKVDISDNGKIKKDYLDDHQVWTYDRFGRDLCFEKFYTSGKKFIPANKTFTYRTGAKKYGREQYHLYHYNDMNNLDMAIFHKDGIAQYSKLFTYDDYGNLTGRYVYRPNGERGSYSQSEFTPDGKLIRNLNYDGQFGSFVERTYNQDGKIVDVVGYDSDTTRNSHYHYSYDQRGNLIARTYFDWFNEEERTAEEWKYDDNNQLITHYNYTYSFGYLKITHYERDAEGRVLKIRSKVQGDPEIVEEENVYDAQGRLAEKVTRGYSTHRIVYTYDDKNRVVKQYEYNENGDIYWAYDYSYDERGNIVSVLSNHEGRCHQFLYTYTYWE